MTACGYCCYYLERCSKKKKMFFNYIAMKQAKYENVFGLAAY